MNHSQFHRTNCLYLNMHDLIFETNIWLLTKSIRYLSCPKTLATRDRKRSMLSETKIVRRVMRKRSKRCSCRFFDRKRRKKNKIFRDDSQNHFDFFQTNFSKTFPPHEQRGRRLWLRHDVFEQKFSIIDHVSRNRQISKIF